MDARNKRPATAWVTVTAAVVVLLAWMAWPEGGASPAASGSRGGAASAPVADGGAQAVERAFEAHQSGATLEVAGVVRSILPDDRDGARHQRFVVELASGRTLLVAHNIDLAFRVPVEVGDAVELRGDYEWNNRGGVLHWTHHDPDGRREGGWVRHEGNLYQ